VPALLRDAIRIHFPACRKKIGMSIEVVSVKDKISLVSRLVDKATAKIGET